MDYFSQKKFHVNLQFIANDNKHKHLYYLINRFPPMQPIYLEALVINMEMAPKLAAAKKEAECLATSSECSRGFRCIEYNEANAVFDFLLIEASKFPTN